MNSKLLSSILSNILWLIITFACITLLQHSFLAPTIEVNGAGFLAMAIAIFCCAGITDILVAKETRNPLFNFIVFFLLSVSSVFIFVSQVIYPLPYSSVTVVIILSIFIALKVTSLFFSSDWKYPNFMRTKVMIVGDYKYAQSLQTLIDKTRGRFVVQGVIALQPRNTSDDKNGSEERRESQINLDGERLSFEAQRKGVKIIIASFPERRGQMPVQQLLKCRMLGIKIIEAQTFYEFITRKLYIENIKPSDLIFSTGFVLSIRRRAIKRVLDVMCAIIGLILFAPFFPLVALLITLDSPGPIFFRQVRVGRDDKLFHIIKFRTMRADAEKATGAVWALKEDPRITRLGSFLRKSRIDEIPQLINILQGEMSLVGPRPERPEFINELKKSIPFYAERHHVKPGVTGWAQVCYPYGASVEDALEKLRYDLYYIKRQSLFLDINIVLRTVLIVFTRNGAR